MPSRRAFVKFAMSRELSARRACELAGVSRRRLGYASRRRGDVILARLRKLAAERPRFGYRRLHQMLKREGHRVNVKRARRLCVLHGLKLSRKVRRKRRGRGLGVPCRAQYPNHVWAYDFVHDMCRNSRKLKILTVEDEFIGMAGAAETVEQSLDSVSDEQLVVVRPARFREVQKALTGGRGKVAGHDASHLPLTRAGCRDRAA